MNATKTTGLLAVAFGLVCLATPAAAQTEPTLTVTVIGQQVTIDWNDIPGALGYQLEAGTTPGGSQIGAVALPVAAFPPRPIVITVPPGTYYLRVRGLAIGIVGPPSNEVQVVVGGGGGGGCAPLTTPTLTSSVNGPAASFAWDAPAGNIGQLLQFGSAPGRTDIAQQLSSTVNTFAQTVPFLGTFFARVVAANACGQTVTSNEVAFTISNPCASQSPALTASVQGGTVTFNWTGVAAPTALRLELSRFDGHTEVGVTVNNPAAGTFQHYIPLVGTFYARIVVQTPCEVTASAYVPFTITNPNAGGGPRTPNPPPGQLLPVPGYGAAVIDQVAAQYPGDLARACHDNTIWLFRAVRELRRYDSRWGLNWKRGHEGSLSADIVAYNGTDQPDEGNGRVYIYDVISAICEGNAPAWQDATPVTWSFAGSPECAAGTYCTRWTLQPYLAAGFPPDPQE